MTRWIAEAASLALVAGTLAVTVAVVVAGVAWALAWATSWDWVVGFASGIGATILTLRLIGWNRNRLLRELLDWLGEDLEARKLAELRREQRIRHLRGQLP